MLMRKLVPHFMPSWDDYYIHCMPQSFYKVCFMYKSTVICMSTNQQNNDFIRLQGTFCCNIFIHA